ncbi:MAG: hypothetical protein SOT71_08270 [Romboutsia timonensis]|uniref:hypothetical protein n=1 Tax=Romboutsia timonensis TaxID=1776391 RepID=UPI002A763C97|nr:hypothetical protein [Romboutsia timonensis]MDY2882634.1 hypothetical protein [Romboutsia timonensis]
MSKMLKLNQIHNDKIGGYEKSSLSNYRNGHSTIHGSDITLIDYTESELSTLKKIIILVLFT